MPQRRNRSESGKHWPSISLRFHHRGTAG